MEMEKRIPLRRSSGKTLWGFYAKREIDSQRERAIDINMNAGAGSATIIQINYY